jgi:phosphoglycolate phosphatase
LRVDCVIFDLDGTILNTLPDLADSLNAALAARGLAEVSEDGVRLMIGDGAGRLVARALDAVLERPWPRDPALDEAVAAEFRSEYRQRRLAKTRPYPGVAAMVDGLAGRGIRLACVSNKDHDATAEIVGVHFPGRFQFVRGARQGFPLKPDPAVVLEALAATGADRGRTLYVGDSAVDMMTAANASLPALGVSWGFRPAGELWAAGARLVLAGASELLDLVGDAAALARVFAAGRPAGRPNGSAAGPAGPTGCPR